MRVWKPISPYLVLPRSHLASSCRRSSPQLSCVSWTCNRGTTLIWRFWKAAFSPPLQLYKPGNSGEALSVHAGRDSRAGRAAPRLCLPPASVGGHPGWGRAQKTPTWKNTPPAAGKWSPPAAGSAGRSAAPCARCSPRWSLGVEQEMGNIRHGLHKNRAPSTKNSGQLSASTY